MDHRIHTEKTSLEKLEDEQPKASDQEVEAAKPLVISAIKDNGCYAFWSEIKNRLAGKVTEGAISSALYSLIKDGNVRKKEDKIQHDWEYRLVTN